MTNKEAIQKITLEIQKGMQLAKCKKCACMKETLENLLVSLLSIEIEEDSGLLNEFKAWLKVMQPIKYTCLGCEYCFPAVATNILMANFPSLNQTSSMSCNFEVKEEIWPPVAGEYFAFCKGPECPVAVSTLASVELAETLAEIKPKGLCIVGKTATENIGIDKVIKNIITNSTIRYLIVAGRDPQGHYSGKTLMALSERGVDECMKVIGSPGRRPVLKNVSFSEVESFRNQVQVIDMIGCEDPKSIEKKIDELASETISACKCQECHEPISPALQIPSVPKITATEPKKLNLDKAGYFVIIPDIKKRILVVEHYGYDNKLLHIIEGKDAPSIYSTIIENRWITDLGHAAYLGRELAIAELGLKPGFKLKYVQDRAPGKTEDEVQ